MSTKKLKAAVSQCVEEAKLCRGALNCSLQCVSGIGNNEINLVSSAVILKAQMVELNLRKHIEIAITSSATSWQLIWGTNIYDTREKCEGHTCYDFSNREHFLTLKFVKTPIGVSDIEFVSCSSKVNEAMLQDWMRNLEVGIHTLLEDEIKLLVYVGEYDLICNWLGNSKWLDAVTWSGQKKYLGASMIPFSVDGVVAGMQKGCGPLAFLKVHDACYLVPMDRPKNSLEMLTRWIARQMPLDSGRPLVICHPFIEIDKKNSIHPILTRSIPADKVLMSHESV